MFRLIAGGSPGPRARPPVGSLVVIRADRPIHLYSSPVRSCPPSGPLSFLSAQVLLTLLVFGRCHRKTARDCALPRNAHGRRPADLYPSPSLPIASSRRGDALFTVFGRRGCGVASPSGAGGHAFTPPPHPPPPPPGERAQPPAPRKTISRNLHPNSHGQAGRQRSSSSVVRCFVSRQRAPGPHRRTGWGR